MGSLGRVQEASRAIDGTLACAPAEPAPAQVQPAREDGVERKRERVGDGRGAALRGDAGQNPRANFSPVADRGEQLRVEAPQPRQPRTASMNRSASLRCSNPRTKSSAYLTRYASPRTSRGRHSRANQRSSTWCRYTFASSGDITAPCGVPRTTSTSSPASMTPAFSHFRMRRSTRWSPIRISRNCISCSRSMLSKYWRMSTSTIQLTLRRSTAYASASSASCAERPGLNPCRVRGWRGASRRCVALLFQAGFPMAPRSTTVASSVSSPCHFEPCVRFSRTRLSDVLHREACGTPCHGRLGRGATTCPPSESSPR